MHDQLFVVSLLHLFVSEQNRGDQDDQVLDFLVIMVRLALLVSLNNFEVSVDLVVVAVLVIPLESLQSRIDAIKDDAFFLDEVLHDQFYCLLAKECEEGHLEVL